MTHVGPARFSCPICHREFGDARAMALHTIETTKHENIFTYVRRLQFMLAETEDNLKFWRDVRQQQGTW
jgi:hypothetical protein